MPKTRESRIYKVFQALLSRLPSTYPKVSLVIHPTITALTECYKDRGEPPLEACTKEEYPYAFCDGDNYSVHVSHSFYNENVQSMVWYFLHEIGHLYALQKYGDKDSRWANHEISEQYANAVADRWVKKLKKEAWFKQPKF